MIDKLIEAVKAIKENPSVEENMNKEDSKISTEEALGNLFPSISAASSSRQSELTYGYNPKANYVPKKGFERYGSSSSSSCSHTKRKPTEVKLKYLLKDFILLPGPQVETVPRGRFREYLYANGFAESAVAVDDEMSEDEVRSKISCLFKEKLARLTTHENNFEFVRAIGNQIVKVNNGPFTGKLLKHISKQGPVYLRTLVAVPGAGLKGWRADKSEDSSDDDFLMSPTFEMKNDIKSDVKQSMPPRIEVIDCDKEDNDGKQEQIDSKTSLAQSHFIASGSRSYGKYSEIVNDKEEEDMQYALQVSLEESQNIESRPLKIDVKKLLQQHSIICMKSNSPNEIIVRRSKLLATAFVAMKSKRFDCYEDLIIQFSGEDAIDAGVPRREFFRLARQEIVQSSGLFEGYNGCNLIFTHNVKLLQEKQYWLAGRLVGISLMQGGPGFGCLNSTVYDLMCEAPCDVNDFDVSLIPDYEKAAMLSKLK
ncbi:uncharacterized protein LOC124447016 isoform X2 [Xenia sp. Carnegie-2017]|uniref:uncharacterized protein LOC124447016 isoform X2 n=1 Tax=Xenia sp. Carnegie-2017 TaxID=2897299 RepID=UPI001F041722|nr:uncharacterized protein LOC124447016 isoform X2 [Xenia sp. Carnegie-2017]